MLKNGEPNPSEPRERWFGVEFNFPHELDEILGMTNNKQSYTRLEQVLKNGFKDYLDDEETTQQCIERIRREDPQLSVCLEIAWKINEIWSDTKRTHLNMRSEVVSSKTELSGGDKDNVDKTPQEKAETAASSSDEKEGTAPKLPAGQDRETLIKTVVEELVTKGNVPKVEAEQIAARIVDRGLTYAIVNRRGFHHRRIAEYLAAKWVAARMERGCPQIELENTLTETVRGRKILRPSLRSIAAWLCCGSKPWNHFVRSLVLETDPGIHLKYGDPAGLPIEYRRQVLSALSRLSRNRSRIWMDSSPDSLARLADSALAADVSAQIADRALALDLRIELLGIVEHGRLTACADAAFHVIESPDEPAALKSQAASAIGALGEPRLDARLFQLASQAPHIPNQLCRSVIEALYPKRISAAELAELLAKTEDSGRFGIGLPFYLKSHVKSAVTPNIAGALLRNLNDLAKTPPLVRRGEKILPISEKFYWLGGIISTGLEILLQKPLLLDEEVAVTAESLQLLGHINSHDHFTREDVGGLNAATLRHPEVRRRYLWNLAAEFRRDRNKEPTMSLELFDHFEVLRPSTEDFSWLLEDIRGRAEPNDRLLALRLAMEAWDASGRTIRNRWRLRRAAARDSSLSAVFRGSAVTGPLFPFKRFWWSKVRYRFGGWWWVRKWDAVRGWMRWVREQTVLLRRLRLLASGKNLRHHDCVRPAGYHVGQLSAGRRC